MPVTPQLQILVQNMPDTRQSKASVSSLAAEVNVQGQFVTLATLPEMLSSRVQNKKEEKESVTEEEEELFWNLNLLGMSTAKSLLNTVYFYNGKLFGLRGGEHRY